MRRSNGPSPLSSSVNQATDSQITRYCRLSMANHTGCFVGQLLLNCYDLGNPLAARCSPLVLLTPTLVKVMPPNTLWQHPVGHSSVDLTDEPN